MKRKWIVSCLIVIFVAVIIIYASIQKKHTFTLAANDRNSFKSEQIQPLFGMIKVNSDCDTSVVFTDVEALQKDAIKAGAIKAGLDDLMTEIEGGFMDFDYCIATPDAMKKLSRVARKLGPRGLMPNPKNGNITDKVIEAINVAKKGKINFKNDKYGIVHTMVGKVNFDDEDLIANIKTVISAVKEAKPEVVKNKYIKSVFLTTTMGPSVAVDIERTNGGE